MDTTKGSTAHKSQPPCLSACRQAGRRIQSCTSQPQVSLPPVPAVPCALILLSHLNHRHCNRPSSLVNQSGLAASSPFTAHALSYLIACIMLPLNPPLLMETHYTHLLPPTPASSTRRAAAALHHAHSTRRHRRPMTETWHKHWRGRPCHKEQPRPRQCCQRCMRRWTRRRRGPARAPSGCPGGALAAAVR